MRSALACWKNLILVGGWKNAGINMDSGGLAHDVLEGNKQSIRNQAKSHSYDILAKIWF